LKIVILLVFIGFLIYANSFNNSFIKDDGTLIVENYLIKNCRHIFEIFKRSYTGHGAYYRPLAIVSHLIEYPFYRLNPFGYHITNTVLHIFNAALVYLILNLLFRSNKLSLMTSLLFLVHPIQTEEVTYISGRCGLMGAFFLLSAFLFYLKYFQKSKRGVYYFGTLLCFILGVFSKEAVLVFPLILVLYNYCLNSEKQKPRALHYVPFFAIAILYYILRSTLGIIFVDKAIIWPGLFQRLFTMGSVFMNYISLLFFPFGLQGDRLILIATSFEWLILFYWLVLVVLITLLISLSKGSKRIVFGLGWFFIMLLPVSQIIPLTVKGYMLTFEHFLYLPSIGFFTILSLALLRIAQSKLLLKKVVTVFFVMLLVFYSLLTIKRNAQWRDPITFYELTLTQAPYSARNYDCLGRAYGSKGDYKRAIKAFQKAIELKSDYRLAYKDLGLAYTKIGQYQESIAALKKAIALNSEDAQTHNIIGLAYSRMGWLDVAIESYQESLKIDPNYAQAHNNLGIVYEKKGLPDKAKQEYQKAAELNPDYFAVKDNLKRQQN